MTKATELNFEFYFTRGLTYAEYYYGHVAKIAAEHLLPEEEQDHYLHYIELNLHRVNRLNTTFKPDTELTAIVEGLKQPLRWLIISEYWCGDAAQNVPVLAAIARASKGKIDLRLVFRDENLELMDAFLTNGTRSIPKLIQLNEAWEVMNTWTWGPRPATAQQLVKTLRSNPETLPSYAKDLHLWYAKNRSEELVKEITELLKI
ncbi:MAG TPA: thioredoxin family protein [Bacteroidia bacterium]|nr:thioredoxin family protein [Bacteroidia bacterium]